MTRYFKTGKNGESEPYEREVKFLLFRRSGAGDYYDGKPHRIFTFEDEEGNLYIYQKVDSTNYSAFDGLDICPSTTKATVKMSGYFVPGPNTLKDQNFTTYYIVQPRILDIQED